VSPFKTLKSRRKLKSILFDISSFLIPNGRSHFESAGLFVKISNNNVDKRSGGGGDLPPHKKQSVDADSHIASLCGTYFYVRIQTSC
jgi:hypothetical protein